MQQERNKVQYEFVSNVVKAATTIGLTVFAPQFLPVLAVVSATNLSSVIGGVEGGLPDSQEELSIGLGVLSGSTEIIEELSEYYQKNSELSAVELEEQDAYNSTMFDKGGWVLYKDSEPISMSRNHFNSFGAVMKEVYLNNHGVTEYLNQSQLNEYKAVLEKNNSDIISGKAGKDSTFIDEQVIDYLTNPGSLYTYDDLDWINFDAAIRLLSKVGGGKTYEDFQLHMNELYEVE